MRRLKSSTLESVPETPALSQYDSGPLLVTILQVAATLGAKVSAVRALHWNRKLRFAKLGKKFVISAAKMREFAATFGARARPAAKSLY